MVDYSKAKLFKIIDKKTGNICICKTIQSISERVAYYKKMFQKYKKNDEINDELKSVFIVIQNDDYISQYIKDIPSKSMEEMKSKYIDYINSVDCVNNGFIKRIQKKTKFSIKKIDTKQEQTDERFLIVF